MKINRFEELDIWMLSTNIAIEIYKLTSGIKFSKDFALRDQIRRAVVSIPSNIAEGFERNNNNEFMQYLKISKGSCGEVRTQLYIGLEIGYISRSEYERINNSLLEIASKIGKLMTYLQNKRVINEFKNTLTR